MSNVKKLRNMWTYAYKSNYHSSSSNSNNNHHSHSNKINNNNLSSIANNSNNSICNKIISKHSHSYIKAIHSRHNLTFQLQISLIIAPTIIKFKVDSQISKPRAHNNTRSNYHNNNSIKANLRSNYLSNSNNSNIITTINSISI